MANNESPAVKPWAKYRTARLQHARALHQLATICRDQPRCPRCSIVIDLKPDAPCCIVNCPVALSSTASVDRATTPG